MKTEKSNIEKKSSGDRINLKIDLEDAPINPKLKKLKSLSVSELVNQPENVRRFSIASFAGAMRKGIMMGDLNRTEADLTPFNTMEILSESSFTSNPYSTRSSLSNISNKSNF